MRTVDMSEVSGRTESELWVSPTLVDRGKYLTIDRLNSDGHGIVIKLRQGPLTRLCKGPF
jgi:hypothetical protein